VKRAVDEIIKFNCFTLEFNYMHDIYLHLLDLVVAKTGSLDWGNLFAMYNTNKDNSNLLDKNELRALILDLGAKTVVKTDEKGEKKTLRTPGPYQDVTESEVSFCFNVMSFFQKHLRKQTFLEWVTSMAGRPKKDLIYYS
jgi:hypothetical protein